MKRLFIIGLLVLALLGSVIFLTKRRNVAARPSPPQDASLQLLGLTNLPAGSFAVFCLSDGTGMHIACMPEAFEQASAGAWVRMALTGRGWAAAQRGWIGLPEELKPGQWATFMVPPPTTNRAWRLVFLCQEQARLIDPVTDMVRHLTDTNAIKTQLRQFSGRRYYTTSPEVVQ